MGVRGAAHGRQGDLRRSARARGRGGWPRTRSRGWVSRVLFPFFSGFGHPKMDFGVPLPFKSHNKKDPSNQKDTHTYPDTGYPKGPSRLDLRGSHSMDLVRVTCLDLTKVPAGASRRKTRPAAYTNGIQKDTGEMKPRSGLRS